MADNQPPKQLTKPSYSKLNIEIPACKQLSRKEIMGYRLMYPNSGNLQNNFTTISAESPNNNKEDQQNSQNQSLEPGHKIEDLPLGSKLPHISGNQVTLQTTAIGKRLQKPSCDFDISTPKETYVSNEYNDLHDPHLASYFQKNESLKQHLIDMGYITDNGAVICSLQKYNLYRQYLKRLSIDLLNKKYHEQFAQETQRRKEQQAKAIEDKKNSEFNAINVRINEAKSRRYELDAAKEEKYKSQQFRLEEKFAMADALSKQTEIIRQRNRVKNEEAREKRKQIQIQKELKEQKRIHELVLKKHYEDQKRIFELTKKKKKTMMLRKQRLEENFVRKTEYHKHKQAQLVVLAAEHESRRQARVSQWEEYFNEQLRIQQARLAKIREKQNALRQANRRKASMGEHGDHVTSGSDSDTYSITQLSSISSLDSMASTATVLGHQSNYILKQVFHSLKYNLPSLMQAMEDYEYAHGMPLSDLAMHYLICKINTEGIIGAKVFYDKDNEQFEIIGGKAGHLKFHIACEDLIEGAGYRRRTDSYLGRRNTPAHLGLQQSETILEENEGEDINEELLGTTVKALSYKVVRRVMKNCGLKVAAADVMGVTMSILNKLGETNFEFSDDSTSQASTATESTASSHAHSITMHDMADRFIMHLLGMDSDRSTTELSHSVTGILTGEDGTTDTETHRSALLDHEDINQMALDVVREALNKQNDELDKDKQFLLDGSTVGTAIDTSTSGQISNIDDAKNLEMVKDDITKRIRGLTSNVVKNVVKQKVKDGDICEQSLVSQDVLYIEKRVQNLADNILVSLVPGLEPDKTPRKNKKITSARSAGKRSGASSARYTGRTTPSSQLSTLPDCYDTKVSAYTTRIIETLLNMKRIMPHPKQRLTEADRTGVGAIARCINFEELYKAPKAAFNLDANEISALAQNLADKISFLDAMETPSERESPRDGLVAQLADDIMGKPALGDTKKTYSPVPISSSSDMSDVANNMVKDIIKKGKFTIPIDVLSEAGSSLADEVLDREMNRAQKHAQDSAESALEEMAKDAHGLADLLVQTAVDDEKDSISEVDSVDSIADRLAGLIVDYGEEKYLKENLDQKAKHVGREVSTIAHDLIKELLQSARSTSVGNSNSGKESYLKGSMSLTSTATLESVISEAIGALAQTCIKSDPSDEQILRNKSEVALRNLLRALKQNFREEHDEDARSVGSSGASVLADDLASTVIDRTEKKMNLHDFGTVTKPDWRVTRGVQVDGKPIQRQANELMTAILGELNEVTPSERTLKTTESSTGYDDMDEAATQVSKLLVKKLVPTLVEHFRPPTPPKVKEASMSCVPKTEEHAMATSSCFADFRKAGIAKRKQVKLADFESTSQSSVYYSDAADGADVSDKGTSAKDTFVHSQTLSSQSKFANRIDQLANDIVTKAMKDDIANNNLRKGVQIQGLVNDLALGIVETVLAKNDNQKPKSSHQKKNLKKKQHKPSKPTGPSADIMLQKALYRQKQVKKQSDKKIDDLAENLVSRINERQSGSSRMDSGRSHESEVEKLLKGVHDGLPEALNVTPSPRSGESEMAEGLIPTQVGISPRSNTTGSSFGGKMLDQLVKGSIIDGQMSTKSGASSIAEDLVAQSMKYGIKSSTLTEGSELVENLLDETLLGAAANTKSDQSSVAENLIQQAYDNAQQSTVSTGESYVERMVAKSIIDNAATTLSTKSSFAEKIVAAGFKEGEKQALSKSPCSSVAEDIVRNLSGIASSKSEASHLAEDLLEHVQDDLNPRSLVKSAGTSKSAGTNLASDIANSILRGLDKDQEEKTGSKMELPASNVNLMKKQNNQVPESKTVSKSSLPKSKISLRPTSGQKSKTGSKMSLPKSKMSLNKQ